MPVEVVQAAFNDGLRHGLAAGTAHVALFAEDFYGVIGAGRHRLAAAKLLGLRQITALISPDEALAFRILALNTEKAHNLKDRSLEVIRMARALAEARPRAKESDFASEFEAPELLTLGIVYEHFHASKTIRGATTMKLVPEQYVEVNPDDAKRFNLRDGQKVRLQTRRGSYEARVTIGTDSMIRPARTEVPEGLLFSPWNLSVADDADPRKNRWLVNATSHRAWDPVSGQADYKKLAARIELI